MRLTYYYEQKAGYVVIIMVHKSFNTLIWHTVDNQWLCPVSAILCVSTYVCRSGWLVWTLPIAMFFSEPEDKLLSLSEGDMTGVTVLESHVTCEGPMQVVGMGQISSERQHEGRFCWGSGLITRLPLPRGFGWASNDGRQGWLGRMISVWFSYPGRGLLTKLTE